MLLFSLKRSLLIFTGRKQSLGQGNIFIGVCQEFCSRGVPGSRGVCSQGGAWLREGCLLPRGCLLPGRSLVRGVPAPGGVPVPRGVLGGDLPRGLLLRAHPTGMHYCLLYDFRACFQRKCQLLQISFTTIFFKILRKLLYN